MRDAEKDLDELNSLCDKYECPSKLKLKVFKMLMYYINGKQAAEAQINRMKSCLNCGQDKRFCLAGESLKFVECWENDHKYWLPKYE